MSSQKKQTFPHELDFSQSNVLNLCEPTFTDKGFFITAVILRTVNLLCTYIGPVNSAH